MQEAFVALARDGILGLGEIEDNGTVFNDYGIARGGEEVFDCADKGFRSHSGIVSAHGWPRL
jgi:hypothetical protein